MSDRDTAELQILNAIARALNAEASLGPALETALARVAELLELETGWVWLLDSPEGCSPGSESEPSDSDEDESNAQAPSGSAWLAAARALPPALAEHPERMAGGCYCLDTFRQGDLAGAANVNVVTCSRLKWLTGGTRGLRYHASVPIRAGDRQLGILNVASPDWRELSGEDLRLLRTVGDMLGVAIERARLFEQSTHLGALEERNRLAREIHDTLAQSLAAIAMQIETADALLEDGMNRAVSEGQEADSRPVSEAAQERTRRAREALGRALDASRASLEDARRSVLDLRAAPLEGRGLGEALTELARERATRLGLALDLDIGELPSTLAPRLEVGLYRLAQEALTNVGRHAKARRLRVALTADPRELKLAIEDDGRGFVLDPPPDHGFGLRGMRERARLLGGRLTLESRPGDGTRVEARVPLEIAGGPLDEDRA